MPELVVKVDGDLGGTARLTMRDLADEKTRVVFGEHGWDGNGYDWGEVGQALALMKMSGRAGCLFFDPEGDYLLVLGPNREIVEELAGWLRAAINNPTLLAEAIRFAEEHGLDGCN
jgi:hypothetical protein